MTKLIQIVDISDKILYYNIKAEHSFLEMINAAVSHELRNPLNSLIGQVSAMKDFFKNFRAILKEIQQTDKSLAERLQAVHNGLEKCSKKMSSACTFIDFFVHDILDYTILNKDSKNFIKDCKNFSITRAIHEICHILEDKISLK